MCYDGTICWKSYKSATMAIQADWKNVYGFRGGFLEWAETGLPLIFNIDFLRVFTRPRR